MHVISIGRGSRNRQRSYNHDNGIKQRQMQVKKHSEADSLRARYGSKVPETNMHGFRRYKATKQKVLERVSWMTEQACSRVENSW
jgi:hypothetical protein